MGKDQPPSEAGGEGRGEEVRPSPFGIRHSAFGIWRLAFGVWRLALGVPTVPVTFLIQLLPGPIRVVKRLVSHGRRSSLLLIHRNCATPLNWSS